MRFQSRLLNVVLYCCLWFPCVVEAKLNIVTTTSDLAAIAQEIGGEKVKVTSLTKGNQDPHYIDPKPSMILRVNKADVLIDVGASLEIGWLPTLIQNARNGKILIGATGRIDASENVRLLEVSTTKVDRSMGDVHPAGNPHYWLDPRNGLILADGIAERLTALDPGNATIYTHNRNKFRQNVTAKIEDWETRMAPYRNRKIVVYHKQWEYLADWLGIEIVGQIEPKPGIPPSPKHIAALIRQMHVQQVQVILSSKYVSAKAAKQVADKAQATLVLLPTSVGGEKGVESYVDLFEHIVSRLEAAFTK